MSTDNNTNPTTAKHQLVSPEGFLRPVEVPDGVATKLVIYVGGSREKIETILRVCEGINSVKECMDLRTLHSLKFKSDRVKHLVFNYRKDKTFTYLYDVDFYEEFIQREDYYEVSYDLFIEKLKGVERTLLFQGYVEELGSDWV